MQQADVAKRLNILRKFVGVYCRKKHGGHGPAPCEACQDLLRYARSRLEKCPFEAKPKCKDCSVHCYAAPYRTTIRQVMRFSGMHFVKRGRLDWLLRYFLSRR